MNLVKYYISFIKQNLRNCVEIIKPEQDDEYKKIIDVFIDLYIKIRYYHEPETLEKQYLNDYTFETVIKEFNGKRIELLYEYKKYDLNNYMAYTEEVYKIVATSILLNTFKDELITPSSIKQILNESIPNLQNEKVINKLCDQIKKTRSKENKFLKGLLSSEFYLKYYPYRYKNTYFHVELFQNVKELDKYSRSVVRKNMFHEKVSEQIFETTLNLLNIDLIMAIKSNIEVTHYFIDIPSELLDQKEECLRLFNMIDTPYLRNKIVFLINYNDYTNHKRIINVADEKLSFAALVDMSHIKAVDEKLANVENIKVFDYVVCDKVKDKDYQSVIKYQTITGKEIFINEVVKE